MYTNLPYLLEGEIISVDEPVIERAVPTYTVRATFADGSEVYLPNVIATTLFGGIADYLCIRSRASTEADEPYDHHEEDAKNVATIGDRVLIGFIGGHIERPIIVGYLPHPAQSKEIEDPISSKPRALLQYLGMRFEINEDGDFRIVHKGAPTVSYKPQDGVSALVGAVLGAIGGLGDEGGASPKLVGPPNPAVEEAETTNITLMEFLKGGAFRVRDADGQLIEMDREKGRIYIANDDEPSTAGGDTLGPQIATNNTDSEYVLLDRNKKLVLINARERITLYSFGMRRDITEADHIHKIHGDEQITIAGQKTDSIGKSWTVSATEDIDLSAASSALSLKKDGKITLKGAGGDIVDLFLQLVTELMKPDAQPTGNMGYPTVISPSLSAKLSELQSKLQMMKQ